MSIKDKEKLFLEYMDLREANLNYLRIMRNISYLSDKIRYKAKLASEKKEDELFGNSISGTVISTEVVLDETLDEIINNEFSRTLVRRIYNPLWISNNLDYPTLLNNFIYLFNFTDLHMRIQLVNKKIDLGSFESLFGVKLKNEYVTGQLFSIYNQLADLSLLSYTNLLLRNNVEIENIIEWFFKEYLRTEFNIENYRIFVPSKGASYLEKCRMINSEMDAILKQYKLLIEDGEINIGLLEMSSSHLFFKDVGSLVSLKYIYFSEKEYSIIKNNFFSDQTMLTYNKKYREKHNTFYELLTQDKINIEDFEEYHKPNLDFLISSKYIKCSKTGDIEFYDTMAMHLYKDLVNNEVINYHHYSFKYQAKIKELVDSQKLFCEDTLFSKIEQDYFNYYLNKSEFSNSLDLRNKYIHGIQSGDDPNSSEHKYNYFVFIKLFILIIIKINDDIILSREIKPLN